jgi:predicted MFS family arabinose efflux permease
MRRNLDRADLDHGWSRVSAILMPLIGGMAFVVQPGFVQGLTQYAGYSDKQAGYLSAIEMTGVALTSVVLAFLVHRLNWRRTLAALLGIVLTGNLLSMAATQFAAFGIVRFIVGLGAGGIISLGFALIGMTSHPERNFGWNIGLAGLYAAVVMFSLPLILRALGLNGILLLFAFCAAVGLALVRFLPATGASDGPPAGTGELPWLLKIPAIAAMLLYFTAQGAVWAYLFLMGIVGGLTEQQVSFALTLAGIAGIAGGFTPVLLGERVGRAVPLTIGIVAGALPLLYLMGTLTAIAYVIAVCIYNFAWNMTHPYLLATYASFDRTGRVVIYATALQTIGMAVGPAIGALVIREGDYSNANWVAIALFVVCLCLLLPAILRQVRERQ